MVRQKWLDLNGQTKFVRFNHVRQKLMVFF